MPYDVAIIGGGIVGCAFARELMRYRVKAVLLEKETEIGFGASKSNSGVIHGGHHAAPTTLKGRLEWEGNQLWDDLCADLGFGFRRIGELTVAFNSDQIAHLESLKRQGEVKGVRGLEIWDQARLRREEPNLSTDIVAALYAPTTGVINPYEACYALIESALCNGLELRLETEVRAITPEDGLIRIETNQGILHSRYVINAAGLYADKIAAMAGVDTFQIIPRKGEEFLLDKRLQGLVRHVIFPCPTPISKGILVTPTHDGTIMVGPTAHDALGLRDLGTSLSGAADVFANAKMLVPGINERDCIAAFAGLRAVSDTDDFIIGTTSFKGFVNVAGIQSPGLTSAPAIARMLVSLLQDQGLTLHPNESFRAGISKPIHFASLPLEEQMRLGRQDPRYSHVVCRCEYVSEGEILDAIRRGARTLDGVKFRTRAGMGRCQGGFCTWRVMQLLANELNVPMTAITKHGGDSWLICNREDAS